MAEKKLTAKELKTASQIKKLRKEYAEKGKLTHPMFSRITGIPQNTLEVWVSELRNPPSYVVTLVQKALERYYDKPKDNADIFRFMTEQGLEKCLSYIVDKSLNAKCEDSLPPSFKDFKKTLTSTQFVASFPKMLKDGDCKSPYDFEYPFPDDVKERWKVMKDFYEQYKLTYTQISSATNVPRDTLSNWISKHRNPPIYVLKYIYRETIESINLVENNASFIRNMNTDELAELLDDICETALEADGDIENMGKYKDIHSFLEASDFIIPKWY